MIFPRDLSITKKQKTKKSGWIISRGFFRDRAGPSLDSRPYLFEPGAKSATFGHHMSTPVCPTGSDEKPART
jgi:hypothetical protein